MAAGSYFVTTLFLVFTRATSSPQPNCLVYDFDNFNPLIFDTKYANATKTEPFKRYEYSDELLKKPRPPGFEIGSHYISNKESNDTCLGVSREQIHLVKGAELQINYCNLGPPDSITEKQSKNCSVLFKNLEKSFSKELQLSNKAGEWIQQVYKIDQDYEHPVHILLICDNKARANIVIDSLRYIQHQMFLNNCHLHRIRIKRKIFFNNTNSNNRKITVSNRLSRDAFYDTPSSDYEKSEESSDEESGTGNKLDDKANEKTEVPTDEKSDDERSEEKSEEKSEDESKGKLDYLSDDRSDERTEDRFDDRSDERSEEKGDKRVDDRADDTTESRPFVATEDPPENRAEEVSDEKSPTDFLSQSSVPDSTTKLTTTIQEQSEDEVERQTPNDTTTVTFPTTTTETTENTFETSTEQRFIPSYHSRPRFRYTQHVITEPTPTYHLRYLFPEDRSLYILSESIYREGKNRDIQTIPHRKEEVKGFRLSFENALRAYAPYAAVLTFLYISTALMLCWCALCYYLGSRSQKDTFDSPRISMRSSCSMYPARTYGDKCTDQGMVGRIYSTIFYKFFGACSYFKSKILGKNPCGAPATTPCTMQPCVSGRVC